MFLTIALFVFSANAADAPEMQCSTPKRNLLFPNQVMLCTDQVRGMVSADAATQVLEANATLSREAEESKRRLLALELEVQQRILDASAEVEAKKSLADAAVVAVKQGHSLDLQLDSDTRFRAGKAATNANEQITGYDGICRPSPEGETFVFDPDCAVAADGYGHGRGNLNPATARFLDQMDPSRSRR